MSKVDIRNVDMRTLDEEIRRDRKQIRARAAEAIAFKGRGDRECLRSVLSLDRAQLHREDGCRNSAELIAGMFDISKWKAARWIQAAHALEHLPRVSSALEAGSLSLDKTVELTRFATPQTEKKLLRWARRVTVGCIRQRGDEAIRAARAEVESAYRDRRLEWWFSDQAMCFEGVVPAEQGVALVEAIDRLAHELPAEPDSPHSLFEDEEPPSIEQRRADALVLLATSTDGADTTKPSVVVHVTAEALSGKGNGVTESGEVLAPELVEMLCCDSRIQTILEDSDGRPLAAGTDKRFPSRELRRAVLRRDGHTCTFPGCGMKRFVDIHHVVAWPKGRTEYDNLVTVCRVHHGLLHKLGWTVTLEDGAVSWFRPKGLRFEPGPAPPDPPPEPKRRPSIAEAAGYSRMFDLIGLLARREYMVERAGMASRVRPQDALSA